MDSFSCSAENILRPMVLANPSSPFSDNLLFLKLLYLSHTHILSEENIGEGEMGVRKEQRKSSFTDYINDSDRHILFAKKYMISKNILTQL